MKRAASASGADDAAVDAPGPAGHHYKPEEYWRDGRWAWDAVYNDTPYGRYYTRTVRRILEQLLANGPQRAILDIGAGTGRFAIPLHRLGHAVTALDIDCRALEVLRHEAPAISTLCAEFMSAEVGSYDMIIAIGVLKYMHPQHLPAFLAKVRDTLRPGGLFVFEMLNPSSLRSGCQQWLAAVGLCAPRRAQFANILSPRECARLLRSCGLTSRRMMASVILVPGSASRSDRLYRWLEAVERGLGLVRLISLGSQYYVVAK